MKIAEWIEDAFQMRGGNTLKRKDIIPYPVDVVIAIGTDVGINGEDPSPQSRAIATSARLVLEEKIARNIIFCGGYALNEITESGAMFRHAYPNYEKAPIPENVYFETASNRTYLNADNTLKIMKSKGWTSAIIVCQ